MENPSQELRPGRLFIRARLNDPVTGGPLCCRIPACEGKLVEYETIYHHDGGLQQTATPWRLRLQAFPERSFPWPDDRYFIGPSKALLHQRHNDCAAPLLDGRTG